MRNLLTEDINERAAEWCCNCSINSSCDHDFKKQCPNTYVELSHDLIKGADLYKKQYSWHNLTFDANDLPESYIQEIDLQIAYNIECLVMKRSGDIIRARRCHLCRDNYFFWDCCESFDKEDLNSILKWMFLIE